MEPEDPAAPTGQHAPTPLARIMSILRLAFLPLAAVALVAVMVIAIPTLGGSSQAAEDSQTQTQISAALPTPDPLAAPGTAEATSSTNPSVDAAAPVPSTPPAPVASPTPTPSGSGEAAGAPPAPEGVAPTRITVAAAGIDVAVLPLVPTADEMASQSIVPPITDDGYWLTSYGAPGEGSTDTTYIAGHSWEGRDAPFDLFSTNTAPGDTIVLDTMAGPLTYVVDDVTTYDKNTLKDSDIWDIMPHRLVIISCYTEDPWGKNVVVTAMPADR